MASTWRTFIAIKLNDSIRENILAAISTLQRTIPSHAIRWEPSENLHLTLKFLGDTPQSLISNIQEKLQIIANEQPIFSVEVNRAGCFPNMSNPRILWLGLHNPSGELNKLQQDVEDIMVEFGFSKEQRPFKPHLTIGRVGRHIDKQILHQIGEGIRNSNVKNITIWDCNAIHLIKSTLTSNGARYTSLAQFSFHSEKKQKE